LKFISLVGQGQIEKQETASEIEIFFRELALLEIGIDFI
jgi:hypothetical protein